MTSLFPGQTLWCLNGETVIIKEVLNDSIEVEYRGQRHKRNKSIIGVKLFTTKVYDSNSSLHPESQYQERELDIPEIRNVEKYGYLLNSRHINTRLSDSSIKENWPKYGNATRFRQRDRKK